MSADSKIIDNRDEKLVAFLRQHLKDGKLFRIVSAYFSLHGYEALMRELNRLEETRFLFGNPESIDTINQWERADREFQVTEDGLELSAYLANRELAKHCEKWVMRDSVQIKTLTDLFLHGKAYQIDKAETDTFASAVGSSNFTKNGLGASVRPNIELNIASEKHEDSEAIRRWFDQVWSDEDMVGDAKAKVLAALRRLYINHPPQLIYYKCLYEIFKPQLEEQQASEKEVLSLKKTAIWQKLYPFQQDAVKAAIFKLQRLGGCILADSVGLGKTYTALAVIKWFGSTNENRVLVICPKRLEHNWRRYMASAAQRNNPFEDDQIQYTLLFHTDLNRQTGHSGGIDLANFSWEKFDLVVIDESHNFRNASSREKDGVTRYQRVMDHIVKAGGDTRVLMLSATPINVSLQDLHNQIRLMTAGKDEAFSDLKKLGIPSIKEVIDAADATFKDWANNYSRDKDELSERLRGDFYNLLSGVTIARSRRQIKEFYQNTGNSLSFPEHRKPVNKKPAIDRRKKMSYKDLHNQISQLKLAMYSPNNYPAHEEDKQQKAREVSLIGMMRVNLLKRLESSPLALVSTLGRMIERIEHTLNRLKDFSASDRYLLATEIEQSTGEEELDDEEGVDEYLAVNPNAKKPISFSDINTDKWQRDIKSDLHLLRSMRESIADITPERDGKLHQLLSDVLAQRQRQEKILIFTASAETAKYLHDQLRCSEALKALQTKFGLVTGGAVSAENSGDFEEILDRFSPTSRNMEGRIPHSEKISVLIATDCISEGQDLQDCDTVLNYDIHWNPVRLIQRFGRIDRIGSRHKSVGMITYWPDTSLEQYLQVEARVKARMGLIEATGTGDNDILSEGLEKDAKLARDESDRRVKQLNLALDIDLEDSPSDVALSDLTFDAYIQQLYHFLRKSREKLEKLPPACLGIFSSDEHAPEGTIFFFKNKGAAETNRSENPIHPFFFIYATPDGIHFNHLQCRNAMDILRKYAEPLNEPDNDLCDHFDATFPQDKAGYSDMLIRSTRSVMKKSEQGDIQNLLTNLNATLPTENEKPVPSNLKLIAWFAVRGPNRT